MSAAPIRRADGTTGLDSTDDLLWLLKQAFHHGRRTVNDAIRHHGVTTAQAGMLRRLADEPGLSGAELARRSLITPQASQLALTALESRGLVERRPDPHHGRILRAYLTTEGRRVADDCVADAVAGHEQFLGVLTAPERALLRDLLLRLGAHAPEDDDDS